MSPLSILQRALVCLTLAFLSLAAAPWAAAQQVWVQIEARSNLPAAEERARAYAGRVDNVVGYSLPSGWYAIALGPYAPDVAQDELVQLRAAGLIPRDSFIADGQGFREQFWPPFGAVLPAPAAPQVQEEETVAVPLEAADETPAEARASERLLSRAERVALQEALKITGYYTSTLDGAIGPGTRRAMAAWQRAGGYDDTGILTTAQRRELTDSVREVFDSLGLVRVEDSQAGIAIDLPLAVVEFSGYEAPFAKYEGDDAQVLLISQSGDRATLAGLYEILQTLEIMPLRGERSLGRNSFTLTGESNEISSFAFASVSDGTVKGFVAVWPQGDELRRRVALDRMRTSLAALDGAVLPDTAGDQSLQRPDLLAGLQIRQPDASFSGFFVSTDGQVLTTASALAACERISLGDEADAEIIASDAAADLALLRPTARLAPIAIGRLSAAVPRLQSDVAVAGYSYGGVLGAPTISFGTLEDVRGLNGEKSLQRLALSVQPGDAGGPVLDAGGGVVGMLLPSATGEGRSLPSDVHFATDAETIAAFLAAHGVSLSSVGAPQDLAPEDLALIGADMTVLVECWN